VGGTTKEEIMRFSLPLERRKAPLPIVIIGTPSLKRKVNSKVPAKWGSGAKGRL
jgi:hypothetical protein